MKTMRTFLVFLTLLFVVLKCFEAITWSWWLVLSPVLVSIGMPVAIIAFLIFLMDLLHVKLDFKFKTHV
jgi:hypothetical protein